MPVNFPYAGGPSCCQSYPWAPKTQASSDTLVSAYRFGVGGKGGMADRGLCGWIMWFSG